MKKDATGCFSIAKAVHELQCCQKDHAPVRMNCGGWARERLFSAFEAAGGPLRGGIGRRGRLSFGRLAHVSCLDGAPRLYALEFQPP